MSLLKKANRREHGEHREKNHLEEISVFSVPSVVNLTFLQGTSNEQSPQGGLVV